MLGEIQKALQWLMLLRKQRDVQVPGHPSSAAGGLLVLLWSTADNHHCTVAAGGPWFADIKLDEVQAELYQRLFPTAVPCSEPDIQELRGFTEMYGPPHVLLSLQARVGTLLSPGWRLRVDDFLHGFSLVNAGVNIHLKLNSDEEKYEQIFSGKIQSKVMLNDQSAMILDVTCSAQPPACIGEGVWCQGGHPELGARLPITIPPDAMDRGLYEIGELSLQPLSIISPCVLPYPNLATRLTHIQVLVYSPSNLPILGPSAFLNDLPASLDCQDLGLSGIHCSTSTDLVHSNVYSVEYESGEQLETEWSNATIEQSLTLFLFLQHSDPSTIQLSDVMVIEELLERHLEDILSHNKQAITTALQTQLKNTLKVQRHKAQKKLCSALEVIVGSVSSIVRSSSNVDFRSACLESMGVHDTHELSTSLHERLRKVISTKRGPKGKCYLAQMDTPPDNSDPAMRET